MKEVKHLIIALLMLIISPMMVNADTASVTISCNQTTVKAGDTFTCTLKGNSDAQITDVDIKVSLGSYLTYGTFTEDSTIWKQGDGEEAHITLSAADATTGTFNIGSFTVTVSNGAIDGTTSVGVTNVQFYKGKTKITGSDNSIPITISNSQATEKKLKSLVANPGILSPSFSPDEIGYTLILNGDVSTFSLTATAQNVENVSFVNPDDGKTLNPSSISFYTASGKAEMMVLICLDRTSCTESEHDYYVMVSKVTDTDEHSGELSKLKVGDQEKSLTPGLYEYTVELTDTSSYQVETDLLDRASYTITYQGLFDNNNGVGRGEGQFLINILPKDNSSGLPSRQYKVTVVKAGGSTTVTPTKAPTTTKPIGTNPPTGGISSVIMGIVLIAAFGVSIYYYRKNADYFTK